MLPPASPLISRANRKHGKIFAANPNKSYEVQKFLIMNKQRLLKFLPKFLEDRTEDDQFNDEKAWLVKAIGNLPDNTNEIKSPNGASRGPPVQQQNGIAQVKSDLSIACIGVCIRQCSELKHGEMGC